MVKKTKKNKEHKFLKKFAGLFLIALGIAFYLAVFSYHQDDFSFNNAKDGAAKNLLGFWGASVADVSAGLGFALPLFMIGFLVWGYKLFRYGTLLFFKWRLFAFVLGVVATTPLLNLIFKQSGRFKIGDYPLAGNVGKNLLEPLNTLLNKAGLDNYRDVILLCVLFLIALLAFNLVVGLTFKSWYHLFKGIFKNIGIALIGFWTGCRQIGNLAKGKKPVLKSKTLSKVRIEPKLSSSVQEDKKVSKAEPKNQALRTKTQVKTGGYQLPSIDLLTRPKEKSVSTISPKEMEATAHTLEKVLQEFGVNGEIVGVKPGPVVTLYEFKPVAGTKTARVIGLADDIARSMCAVSVRIAVVPGTDSIGVEIPNAKRETVWLKDLIEDEAFRNSKNVLNVVLGKDIGGQNVYADLTRMPHLLVAGTTGSGKSVGVNSMILSLLYKMSPQECKMIMIDPKMLEFSMYNDIPHLLTPVITDPAKAVAGLKWAVCEMEERYRKISDLHVRNIFGYNEKLKEMREAGEKPMRTIQVGFDAETGRPIYEQEEIDTTPMPFIVIVVDEVADLMIMARKEVEAAIQRLAQKARAAGIHLIMATQRPSVDVITGVIKANFPTRISFQVTSKFDSMTILGDKGAEQLLGMGDMLYMPSGLKPLRVHGSFVKDSDVEAVANFLKAQGAPEYVEAVTQGDPAEIETGAVFDSTAMGSDKDLYMQAVEIVRTDKKASTSYIQRRLRIGYNKAADLIDRMEAEGIVSPADHVGRREVL